MHQYTKYANFQAGCLRFMVKNTVRIIFFSSMVIAPAIAVEFNTNVIDVEDRQNIDVSQFEKKGYVTPGEYLVHIKVNSNTLLEPALVNWLKIDSDKTSRICMTSELVKMLGLTEDFTKDLKTWQQGQCLSFENKPEVIFVLNKADMVLTITVPQAWLKYQADNWTPPEFWDDGIAGALVDYNLYASQYDPQGADSTQNLSAYGTLGFNLGAWRLRSDYQYDQDFVDGKSTHKEAELSQTYLFRPLPALESKLTLGQFDINSDIFDSFRFTGSTLESDERMLPPDLQGYAPQISGIAQTNAKVTVMQNDHVIYQTTVPPGPFTITDLQDTVQGQLDVTIEEEDGRKSTFQVGSASIPFLTRKGQLRYKASVGKPTTNDHNHVEDPLFFMGEFSWGWLSNTSLYGGTIMTGDDYQALSSGIGFNLNALGSLSFDVTRSDARLQTDAQKTGYSYRFNYAKRFESTGSQVTFAGYRFSDADYMSMSEFINQNDDDDNNDENEKESYVLSFSQYFDAISTNSYLSVTRDTYWDQKSTTSYSVSLSRSFEIGDFKGISASLAASRTRWDGKDETQYYVSISLPLSQNRSLSYNMQRNADSDLSHTLSYYDSSDKNNTWGISGAGESSEWSEGKAAFRGNYQHYSPYGRMNISASVQPDNYNSVSTSWSGSATATKYGAAFHSNNNGNNARIMVDSADISDVSLNNRKAVTNAFGIAVIPSVSSYQATTVRVDNDTLPEDVEISHSVIRNTFTEGAIGYAPLTVSKGYQVVGVIRLVDGHYPPLGVSVVDKTDQREVGLVAENGFVYLSGLQDNHLLELQWGKTTCYILPPAQSSLTGKEIILPCKNH